MPCSTVSKNGMPKSSSVEVLNVGLTEDELGAEPSKIQHQPKTQRRGEYTATDVINTPWEDLSPNLLSWLSKNDGKMTINDMRNGHRGIYSYESAKVQLDVLVNEGLGYWEVIVNPNGGRPKRIFHLNK